MKIPGWDELFFRHVYLISSKSKDLRTKIGAVLVKDKRIISEGYNGICKGVNDNVEERNIKPEKYFFYEHAERNCLYDCASRGISCKGATLFSNGLPCADCGRGVIQSSIVEVVIHHQWKDYERQFCLKKWIESSQKTRIMFNEAGIRIRFFDKILGIQGFLDGKIINI